MRVTLRRYKFARPPCCCYWQEIEKYGFRLSPSAIVLVQKFVNINKLFGLLGGSAVTDGLTDLLNQGSKNWKSQEPPHNFRWLKGHVYQVPHLGFKNNRIHKY